MLPLQNLCGGSLAFTTAANHYFIYFTECIHLFPSIPTFPRLCKPSAKPLQPLTFSQQTLQQTSPRRAFFGLPKSTITCLLACTSRGSSAIVRADLDVRGRLITLRLGPNFRVRKANVYENRWMYSYPRMASGLSFPDLQIRPSHAGRRGSKISGRSARHCIVPEWN